MTREDEEILERQDAATLAEWWCVLNRFGWPLPTPGPRPGDPSSTGNRVLDIMFWISCRIGRKECLRAWNRGSMTDAQFEDFWNARHDPEAARRYNIFMQNMVHMQMETLPPNERVES